MNKIINYFKALLAVVFVAITFTACSEDVLGPYNHKLGIKTFFPTKVVTNQPLTINGSGLDGVLEIEFPGGAKVTDFEIVSEDMIRVNTPSGIPEDGGNIIVRSATDEVKSPVSLTLGHTIVSGFSKQEGEKATGGEQIIVYGTDLEFIKSVELLDADGVPQLIDHKDFYRKGTSNLVFCLPKKNIFKGTFVGTLHTYDGKEFPMPELTYEPAADGGHYETVKTIIWKNDGSVGEINWSGDYRFGLEGHDGNNECVATFPQDVWDKIKSEQFYVTIKGDNPQIRVTSGWWSTTWTGDDIFPGNDRLVDNGDGTFTLTVDLAGDPLLDVLDEQHLLFTGSGYTVEEIYFAEEIWVDGDEDQEVKVPIWTNDGSLGEINWSGNYRFGLDGKDGNNECAATFPQDVWDRIKSETFYVTIKGESPQIRVTSGWWSTTWTGDDIFPGNELLKDNEDGTFTLTVNLTGDPLLDVLDEQHLLFTGSGYTVEEIYFIDIIHGNGGDKETVFWQGDGSAGEISWNGVYRFGLEGHDGNNECIATFPQDVWDKLKSTKFYVLLQGDSPQIRVTTGWWSVNLTADDIQPGNELLADNEDGTWTLTVDLTTNPDLLGNLDDQHLLLTGSGYTPLKLYFK